MHFSPTSHPVFSTGSHSGTPPPEEEVAALLEVDDDACTPELLPLEPDDSDEDELEEELDVDVEPEELDAVELDAPVEADEPPDVEEAVDELPDVEEAVEEELEELAEELLELAVDDDEDPPQATGAPCALWQKSHPATKHSGAVQLPESQSGSWMVQPQWHPSLLS
ncbi:MAG: hypothetical protein AB2A00_06615 [Myxococcota bacterium]